MKPMKPYIIHRVRRTENLDTVRRASLHRGHSLVNQYKRVLELYENAEEPLEMIFEVFEPREGLTIVYANIKYISDGKKQTRTYHLTAEISDEQLMELQHIVGSPVVFNARQLYVKVSDKPSTTAVKMEIRDKNGDYVFKKTVDRKTGKVSEKTSVDGYSLQGLTSWKRLLTALQMKQNPKNPFSNKRAGVVGEVIVDNKPHVVEILNCYMVR